MDKTSWTYSRTGPKTRRYSQEFREQILRVKQDTNIPFILVGNKEWYRILESLSLD